MYQSSLSWRRGLAATALLAFLLISGCGGDKSSSPSPTPEPNPALTMSVSCDQGLIGLKVKNAGGAMTEASPFIAMYADGYADTLPFTVDKNDSIVCQLSNIHGSVKVTNDEWSLADSTDYCLQDYFQSVLGSIDLASCVPSPLTVQDLRVCMYTVNLRNLKTDSTSVELLRTNTGLTLKYGLHKISGNLSATSPGLLCPDLSGSITITSIVVSTEFTIGAGDDPQVTLGTSEATMNGLAVHADGVFGFIVDYFVQLFPGIFTNAIEYVTKTIISDHAPADLSALVIVKSSCAE